MCDYNNIRRSLGIERELTIQEEQEVEDFLNHQDDDCFSEFDDSEADPKPDLIGFKPPKITTAPLSFPAVNVIDSLPISISPDLISFYLYFFR